MDINAVKDAIMKLSQDEKSKAAFAKDPVKAVESVLGVDLPDEVINNVIKATKEKIAGGNIDDILKKFGGNAGMLDKLKGFFGKK